MAKENSLREVVRETRGGVYRIYGDELINMSKDLHDFYIYLVGLNSVWNNPNIYNPGVYNGHSVGYQYADHAAVPESMRYKRRQDDGGGPSVLSFFDNKKRDVIEDTNKIVSDYKTVAGKMAACDMHINIDTSQINPVSRGQKIEMLLMYNILRVLNTIQDTINTHINYWDSNDLCARSCQINCQVGCQVACQACVASNCHHQHCGACT